MNAPKHKGVSIVFVAKKGCLADYFDTDSIETIYNNEGFRTGYYESLEYTPLINFFNGQCESSGIIFDTIIDTGDPENDPVLKQFGPSALIITGLLYGYPIEITMEALKILFCF